MFKVLEFIIDYPGIAIGLLLTIIPILIKKKTIVVIIGLFLIVAGIVINADEGSLRATVEFSDNFEKAFSVKKEQITLTGDENSDKYDPASGAKIEMSYAHGDLIIPATAKESSKKIIFRCRYIKDNDSRTSKWKINIDVGKRDGKTIIYAQANGRKLPIIGNIYEDKRITELDPEKKRTYLISIVDEDDLNQGISPWAKKGRLKMDIMLIILIAVVAIICLHIRIVPQQRCYVTEFLGKYRNTWSAGIHFLIPFLERVVAKISLKEQVYDYAPQTVITKDNVSIDINAVVFSKVFDSYKYVYGIEDAMMGLENLSATTLRNVVGEMDLDECLASRESINAKMQEALDEATDEWGLKVRRVEIKDIEPPREIAEAMTKQMKAEREKRQAVLEAEAHKESVIRRAEGDKQAKVLAAEAERDAKIAVAEGEAQAIERTYSAQAKGLEALRNAEINQNVLYLRGLDALKEVADGRATKIFVPTDISSVLTSAGAIGEALGVGDFTRINREPDAAPVIPKDPTANENTSEISKEAHATNARIRNEVSE